MHVVKWAGAARGGPPLPPAWESRSRGRNSEAEADDGAATSVLHAHHSALDDSRGEGVILVIESARPASDAVALVVYLE